MDLSNYDKGAYLKFTEKSEIEKVVHEIEGCLQGIVIDHEINPQEITGLEAWIKKYEVYSRKAPFAEIYSEIKSALADNIITQEEIDSILWCTKNILSMPVHYNAVTADIQRLHGMLYGILSDGKINTLELKELELWLFNNDQMRSVYPYDEICAVIMSILKDGQITADEDKYLKAFFSEFIDLATVPVQMSEEIEKIRKEITVQGICSVDPEIIIKDHVLCFTGRSSRSSREEIAKIIQEKEGIYKDNIVSNTNYLIIGDNGNPCWAYSCYGKKVEQAIKLRKNGNNILIIHETDFWDVLE